MKPAWDALMVEFKDNKQVLIADVDCTADGKPLCEKHGVKGYPTVKHGDPNNLEDYKGGRDEKALKAFAKGLKPSCSPANIDLCDAEQKKEINKVQGMSDTDLDAAIAEKEKQLEESEAFFKSEVEKLQKNYEKLQSDKEATATEVKESGLAMMKAVKATKAAGKAEL